MFDKLQCIRHSIQSISNRPHVIQFVFINTGYFHKIVHIIPKKSTNALEIQII